MGQYYYEGEVFLAPPREKVHGMQITLGVIQIKLYNEIRSITISDTDDIKYFDDSKRDSICKQMGFTRAVTASVYTVHAMQTRGAFGILYGFNFTGQYHQ